LDRGEIEQLHEYDFPDHPKISTWMIQVLLSYLHSYENDWRLEKLNNIFTIMASNIIKVIFLNKEDVNEWWWKVLSTILPALILCNFYMMEGRRSWMNSRMWLYRSSSLNMYFYLSVVGITGVRRINRFYLTSEWCCFYYPTSTHM